MSTTVETVVGIFAALIAVAAIVGMIWAGVEQGWKMWKQRKGRK